jgi:hypothetical protein
MFTRQWVEFSFYFTFFSLVERTSSSPRASTRADGVLGVDRTRMLPNVLIQISMLGRLISACKYSNVPHYVMEVKYSYILGLLHQSEKRIVV